MNLEPFTGPGSTPSRRRFWDKVTQTVIASQKVAGRFVTVAEHPGKGTVINVADTSARRRGGGGGVCPTSDPITLTFSGITLLCGCVDLDAGGSEIITGTVDGVFVLPKTGDGLWQLFSAGTVHAQLFNNDDCTDLSFEGDIDTNIQLFCSGGGFTLEYDVGPAIFFSLSTPSPSLSQPNDNTVCGQSITTFGIQNALGIDGTVTISP